VSWQTGLVYDEHFFLWIRLLLNVDSLRVLARWVRSLDSPADLARFAHGIGFLDTVDGSFSL
jgi:hypothetical protein